MKNIYFLLFLFILSSCYKKQVYQQYKIEKHGTVHYEPPNVEKPENPSEYDEMIADGWVIGNAATLITDSINFNEIPVYCDISNPSFEEDIPSHSYTPNAWENCGDKFESSIDIHTYNGWFQVKHSPAEGDQFAGMVVRDNQTHEAIGQILNETLYRGTTYAFSFYVARSQDYISLSGTTLKEENFNKPALLKVKIGDDCLDMEIVGQTNLIESTDWKKYTIIFTPSIDSDFLVLEAFHEDDFSFYNGNILLDNISPIVELPSKK